MSFSVLVVPGMAREWMIVTRLVGAPIVACRNGLTSDVFAEVYAALHAML